MLLFIPTLYPSRIISYWINLRKIAISKAVSIPVSLLPVNCQSQAGAALEAATNEKVSEN